MENLLKTRLYNGETVFGTWSMLPSSFVIDVIACTGVDFVIIDLEHGSIPLSTAEEMVRAAQVNNCQPIIRVGDSNENTILHALETGSNAVLVPHISTPDEAEHISKSTKYFPEGSRGLSPYTRNHGYSHSDISESLRRANQNVLTGILVEGKEGIANLPRILEVNGIDLVYLGIYDISQSVGYPGEIDHPVVVENMKKCFEQIRMAGKIAGTFSRDIGNSRFLKSIGVQFIAYLVDSYALKAFYLNAISEFKHQ